MKHVLIKGVSWGWTLTLIFIIFLGIAFSIARVGLPYLPDYREEIETQVAALLKRPVNIEGMEVSWEGFHPVVVFKDVTIHDEAKVQDVFHFDSLQVTLHLRQSFKQLRPVLRTVHVQGADIGVRRTLDGRFIFKGLSGFKRPMGDSSEGLDALKHFSLQLSDIRFIWNDEPLRRNWEAFANRMNLVAWDGGLAVDADLTLPEGVGKTVNFTSIVRGDLKDYRQWEGSFFVDVEQINLGSYPLNWPENLPYPSAANLATKLWGSWKGVDTLAFEGDIDVKDARIVRASFGNDIEDTLDVDSLKAQIKWQQEGINWHIDADNLNLSVGGKAWKETGLSAEHYSNDIDPSIRFALDSVDLASLSRFAKLSSSLNDTQRLALSDMQVSGQARSLQGEVKMGEKPLLDSLSVQLENLSWHAVGKVPGVSGISASVQVADAVGTAELVVDTGTFDGRSLFENTFEITDASTVVKWHPVADGWNVQADDIYLSNDDLDLFGTAQLELLAGEKPSLYMELGIPQLDLDTVAHYLPYAKIKPKPAKWLREAFIDGEGQNGLVTYAGTLGKEAFKERDADFFAEFELYEGQLHYKDGYPDITQLAGDVSFQNASFKAKLKGGDIVGSSITGGDVGIDDFYRSRLKFDADTKGSLPDLLTYLKESPLRKGKEKLLNSVVSKGPASLNLKMDIPLSKKLKRELSINGRLKLDKNMASIPEHNVRFDDVKGYIDFTRTHYSAQGLSGKFRGEPVTAGIATDEEGTVTATVLGEFSIPQLIPELTEKIAPWMYGRSDFEGGVRIPKSSDFGVPSLFVSSALRGIEVVLPEPLGKQAQERRDFDLSWELGTELPEVSLHYAELASVQALIESRVDKLRIERANVLLGAGEPSFTGEGIGISGHWEKADLNDWVTALLQMREGGGEPLDIREARISLGTLEAVGQSIDNISAIAVPKANGWHVELESQQVAGDIFWPNEWKGLAPVTAKLDRLILSRNGEGVKSSLRPRDLPALEVSCDEFKWGDVHFDRASISTVRSDKDWIIKQAYFDSDALTLDTSGAWLDDGNGTPLTHLRMKATGINLGQAVADLDITSGLGSGEGMVTANVSWEGPPYLPSFASMNGPVTLDVRDGRLKDIDPGLGRLLGLLNLDSLPKRLALNFKDVSVEGFQYDSIIGSGELTNGVLQLDSFLLDGSAAMISVAGLTNLVEHQYDLNLDLVPKVKSAVPLVAGALITPQTGIIVYVADKFVQAMGFDFNKSVTIPYRITGTWENPTIEQILPEPEVLLDESG